MTLAGLASGAGVLRDYADVAHPRTVCQLGTSPADVSLIDAHHLLVAGQGGVLYVVVELPTLALHWFQLPNLPNEFPTLMAVSPLLDQVVYLTTDMTNNTDKVHVASRAGDQVVAALFNPHGGRCGSPEDSLPGGFSATGAHAFVLDQPIPTVNSLLVLNGTVQRLLLAPPKTSTGPFGYGWPTGGQPEMALWAPTSETLYYRQGGDVWKWTEADGAVRFLPGVTWYYPTISADGRYLAYAVLRPDGTHNVYLVDLQAGSNPKLIGQLRNTPVFVNATQLWYRSELQGPCGPGGDGPLVYDVSTGTESPSILDAIYSVWPSTSSNF